MALFDPVSFKEVERRRGAHFSVGPEFSGRKEDRRLKDQSRIWVNAMEWGGKRGERGGRRSVVTTRPHPSSVAPSPDKPTLGQPASLRRERVILYRSQEQQRGDQSAASANSPPREKQTNSLSWWIITTGVGINESQGRECSTRVDETFAETRVEIDLLFS